MIVEPDPDEQEAAAIAAALSVALAGATPREEQRTIPPWRFSGRWWSAPVPARRIRP